MTEKYPDCFIYNTADRWRKGIPDLIIIINGQTTWIELKKPGEKPKPMQLKIKSQIQNAGGHCYVADNVNDVLKIIEERR